MIGGAAMPAKLKRVHRAVLDGVAFTEDMRAVVELAPPPRLRPERVLGLPAGGQSGNDVAQKVSYNEIALRLEFGEFLLRSACSARVVYVPFSSSPSYTLYGALGRRHR